MVGCWVDILDGSVTPQICMLALTDNSSACGWIHKSNLISADHSFHAAIAKKLATLFISADSFIYFQHFAGKLNVISDSLSQDHHISDANLAFLFSTFLTTTGSPKLQYMSASAQNYLVDKLSSACNARENARTSSTNANLSRAWIHWIKFASTYNTMNYSTNSNKKTESDSLAPSPKPSKNENFYAAVKRTWIETRAKRPWKKWKRSLGKTAGLTPAMTYPATLTTISDYNIVDTPTPTPQQNNKRPSPHISTDTTTIGQPPRARKR